MKIIKYKTFIIKQFIFIACLTCILGFKQFSKNTCLETRKKSDTLRIYWKDNVLTILGDKLPGEKMHVEYLEAFCKSGSTNREWGETIIPHKTELISIDDNNTHIKLKTTVQGEIEVTHDIQAKKDEVEFNLVIHNKSNKAVNIDWFQPCIRIDRFTNRKQDDYISRCFIYTSSGLTTLDKTRRNGEAIYRGGQVYAPVGVNLEDVNPRPISLDKPVNGLIGCFSDDNKYIMATAWDNYQELFQGIFVCIHSDPRIGGLKAGQIKKLRGKIYIVKNDPDQLLLRYHKDFSARR